MKLLLSILLITVVIVPMASTRAVLPLRENQGTFVKSHGMLERIARGTNFSLKSLETAAQDTDAGCRFENCEKLEELKKTLLAIIETLTCPDEPEDATESYLSSNDIDLGLIDM